MAKLQASWIHGTSVQPEREGYHVSKKFAGHGATFRTYGKEWFHFSIPTPVIVDGKRASLKKTFVLYKTTGTSKVTNVRVYDGTKIIKAFDKIGLKGDHSASIDKNNTWVISPAPKIKYGVGISVCVDFGGPTKVGVPAIMFTTAGADFTTP